MNEQEIDSIFAIKEVTNVDCQIFVYDNQILFHPILPCVAETLTITEKSLECSAETGFVRKVMFRSREMFSTCQRQPGTIGVTFQGFLHRIIRTLVKKGFTFNVQDLRVAKSYNGDFPRPDFSLMYGFRFSQEELLKEFLSADMSGLIGAPTRYGKTTLMINTLRAFPDLVTVVTAPGVDLVRQLYDDIRGQIRNREVKLICSGSRTKYPSDTGITVCSADSLEKCDFGSTELLLADEPHALVTEGRIRMIDKFPKARRLGFGATLTGRFDGKDDLIEGLFGPVIVERTYKEAVDEGAICPLHIIFLKVEVQPQPYRDRDAAYDDLLFKSSTMANLTKDICEYVIPQEWQTLIFIKHEPQAELFLDAIGDSHTIAMAKRMNKSQREEIADMMRKNVIKRCLCTKIYVQGVTFSDVRVLINAEAGGNNTSAIQKPGRLAEIRPNKKCGIVIDFMFVPPDDVSLSDYSGDPWTCPCRDSLSRLTAYQDKGYEIHEVDTVEELKRVFDSIA